MQAREICSFFFKSLPKKKDVTVAYVEGNTQIKHSAYNIKINQVAGLITYSYSCATMNDIFLSVNEMRIPEEWSANINLDEISYKCSFYDWFSLVCEKYNITEYPIPNNSSSQVNINELRKKLNDNNAKKLALIARTVQKLKDTVYPFFAAGALDAINTLQNLETEINGLAGDNKIYAISQLQIIKVEYRKEIDQINEKMLAINQYNYELLIAYNKKNQVVIDLFEATKNLVDWWDNNFNFTII